MKTKHLNWKMAAVCAAAVLPLCTACNDDNNDDYLVIDIEQPYGAYFIAEGSMGYNNSALVAVNNDTTLLSDLYMASNSRGLGDTGQDVLYTAGRLFATVSGSGYLSEMDIRGYEVSRLAFDAATLGSPRYMVQQDGYLYVTLYGTGDCGYVAKVSYNDSLQLVDTVRVGSYPEQLAWVGGKLVTCNSGYGSGNTLSVIDPETFKVEQTLTVDYNPTRIVTGTNGKGYYLTTSYNEYWQATVTLHELNAADWSSRTVQQFVGAEVRMANAESALYLAVSATADYVNFTTTLARVDYASGNYVESSFVKDESLSTELSGKNVYMLAVNPFTQGIYIATSNYYTNSSLYVISASGFLKAKFADAGGLNISGATFANVNTSEVWIFGE